MCELTLCSGKHAYYTTCNYQSALQRALNNRSMRTEWPWQALFLLTSKRGKSAEPAESLHGNNHLLCCRFSLIARKYSAWHDRPTHIYTLFYLWSPCCMFTARHLKLTLTNTPVSTHYIDVLIPQARNFIPSKLTLLPNEVAVACVVLCVSCSVVSVSCRVVARRVESVVYCVSCSAE